MVNKGIKHTFFVLEIHQTKDKFEKSWQILITLNHNSYLLQLLCQQNVYTHTKKQRHFTETDITSLVQKALNIFLFLKRKVVLFTRWIYMERFEAPPSSSGTGKSQLTLIQQHHSQLASMCRRRGDIAIAISKAPRWQSAIDIEVIISLCVPW